MITKALPATLDDWQRQLATLLIECQSEEAEALPIANTEQAWAMAAVVAAAERVRTAASGPVLIVCHEANRQALTERWDLSGELGVQGFTSTPEVLLATPEEIAGDLERWGGPLYSLALLAGLGREEADLVRALIEARRYWWIYGEYEPNGGSDNALASWPFKGAAKFLIGITPPTVTDLAGPRGRLSELAH